MVVGKTTADNKNPMIINIQAIHHETCNKNLHFSNFNNYTKRAPKILSTAANTAAPQNPQKKFTITKKISSDDFKKLTTELQKVETVEVYD